MSLRLTVALIAAVLAAGCGGASTTPTSNPNSTAATAPPQQALVSVTPSQADVAAGGASQMFVATVSDASDAAVTWQVNGVAGGNSTVGTISQGGVYTSPASTPVPPTVTVTAVSQADPSASASATLTART